MNTKWVSTSIVTHCKNEGLSARIEISDQAEKCLKRNFGITGIHEDKLTCW
jgi:hypothetical protein